MNSARPRPTPLQLWFGLLAGLATVAALQASLLPRWPRASPLPAAAIQAALRQARLQPTPLRIPADAKRGSRSLEMATSDMLAYRLAGGNELRLLRGTARQRDNLQSALFTRDHKDLMLKRRSLQQGPPPLARGTTGGRPTLQTCWVATPTPGGGYGVTAKQLLPLVDSQATGRRAELLRLIGLQPNREFSCVLISLRSSASSPPADAMIPPLLDALPAALENPDGTDGGSGTIP